MATDNTAYSSEDGILFNRSKTTLIQYPAGKSGNSYSIPNSVTSIIKYAFYKNTLTSIDIPGSVTSIGQYAFNSCESLAIINVATDNTAYSSENGVLFNKSKTDLIKYPPAKPATAYSIPASVLTIGLKAFENCLNLTTISIPLEIKDIGVFAFHKCKNLRKIICYNLYGNITMGYSVFYEIPNDLCHLYVPDHNYYDNAAPWKDFNHIHNIEDVTGVTINTTNQTVNIGASFDLAQTVTITPNNASNDIITWSSSNPAIASVDANGIVTGLSVGNATITATTAEGGFTATCAVTVITPVNTNRSITLTVLSGEDIELYMAADADNTEIKIVSGTKTYSEAVGTNWSGQKAYRSDGSTMTIYGNIKKFRCQSNYAKVTGLDASNNTDLDKLTCPKNEITNLNISNNVALTDLNCSENKLQSLNISGNTNLTHLNCKDNQLQNLDLSNNTKLISLSCEENQLSGLDLSNNNDLMFIKCNDNQLNSLDLSNKDQLISLYCYNNAFTTQALDFIYCSLPDRTGSNIGRITPAYNSEDDDYPNVEASTTTNATGKNWAVKFRDGGGEITGTGNYVCGTVDVIGVLVTPTTTTMLVAGTQQLTATVQPTDATNQNVSWSSSDAAVATVDANGVVTGVAAGNATITATTDDGGFSAICTVTVETATVAVTGVTVNPTTATVKVGNTKQITAIIAPANATNQNVTWSSSNTGIATVGANGLVTGVAVGTATVTVTTTDGGFTTSCTVTVTEDIGIPSVSEVDGLSMYPNPVHNVLHIELSENNFGVEFYNMFGQKVLHVQNEREISVSKLPSGIYMLKITTEKGIYSRKIVKE